MSETIITKDKISIDSEKHIFIVISKIGNEYEIQDKEGRLIHITSDDKYVEREVICLWETQADAIPNEVKLVAENTSKADDELESIMKSDTDLEKNGEISTITSTPVADDITLPQTLLKSPGKTTNRKSKKHSESNLLDNNSDTEQITKTKEKVSAIVQDTLSKRPSDIHGNKKKESKVNEKNKNKQGTINDHDHEKDSECLTLFADIEKNRKIIAYLKEAYKQGFPNGCFYLIQLNNINSIFAIYEMLSDLYNTHQIDKKEINVVLKRMPKNTIFAKKTSRLIIDDLKDGLKNDVIEKIHKTGLIGFRVVYDKISSKI